MTAPSTFGLSTEARNLHWLLSNLVEEVPGVHSVTVVSSDGLMLLSSDPGHLSAPEEGKPSGPRGSSADLATIVSGIGSLTVGAAKLMEGGGVKQTMVAMEEGSVFVMSISDGSLLGARRPRLRHGRHRVPHGAVRRPGRTRTHPELRSELRKSMESAQ